MKLVEINWHPTTRQLRQFGVICGLALPLVPWLWGCGLQLVAWLGAAGFAVACLGVAVPKVFRPAFLALSLVATPVGAVLGELAMLVVYFGVFLPIGLTFRLVGRDALKRQFEPDSSTYWQPRKRARDARSYYRQS